MKKNFKLAPLNGVGNYIIADWLLESHESLFTEEQIKKLKEVIKKND